ERGAGARHPQARLNDLLERIDIVLKVARKKFADLLIKTVNVGDKRQQPNQKCQSYADADHQGFLRACDFVDLGVTTADALSIRPSGRCSFARSCFSRLAISPLSHS